MPAARPRTSGFDRRSVLWALLGGALAHIGGVPSAEGRKLGIQFPVGPQDLDTAARTVWGESRGEDFNGKVAVAWVIRNRAERAMRFRKIAGKPHALFGDGSVRSACLRPRQFSCWNSDDVNACKVTGKDLPGLEECLRAVVLVMSGAITDPTHAAVHYCVRSLRPAWARGKTPCAIIGGHAFYNTVQ